MAITKTKHITATLSKAIAYICNQEKTDAGVLISSFGCAPETADLEFALTANQGTGQGKMLAHHLIQSFKPGEVSVDEAHQIGLEWAKTILKDQYEFVLSTHIDKGHIHNHIIFNSTSFVTHRKYNDCKKTLAFRMRQSDEICKQHGLSVIENRSGKRGKGKYEYEQYRQGTSWKENLRLAIDDAIENASNWDEFITIMELKGYEVTRNKNDSLKFKAIGQQRPTRIRRLGEFYTENKIKDRIERKDFYKNNTQGNNINSQANIIEKPKNNKNFQKGLSLIVDLKANRKAQNSAAYKHALEIGNANQLVKTIAFLEKNNLQSYSDFMIKYNSVKSEYDASCKICKNMENDMAQLSEKIKFCRDFFKVAKDARRALRNPSELPQFKNEVLIYNSCLKYFEKNNMKLNNIKIKEMIAQYKELTEQYEGEGKRKNELRAELKNLNIIKSNIEITLGSTSRKKDTPEK